MIIEASFFKLFSYVSAVDKFQKETQPIKVEESPKFSKERNLYESQIVGMFADIIKNELCSLGIFVPARFVIQEYPYPSDSSKQVDIFVNLEEYIKKSNVSISYVSQDNYIEVKSFIQQNASKSSPPKTENIGRILNEILRLTLLTSQRGLKTIPAHYLLIIFKGHPKKYLSYTTKDKKERKWIKEFFIPLSVTSVEKMPPLTFLGTIELDLSDKEEVPDVMFNKLKEGFEDKIKRDSILKLSFIKYCIFPLNDSNNFYFFLFRFFKCSIR